MKNRKFTGLGVKKNNTQQIALAIMSTGFFMMFCLVLVLVFTEEEQKPNTIKIETDVAKIAPKLIDVLVPKIDIEVGTELTPELFNVEQKHEQELDVGNIRSFEQIRRQYARAELIAGFPLHKDHLISTKANPVILNIEEGYRAITVKVNETSSVYGWAQPGSHVDVKWSGTTEGKAYLVTLVENAKILSVDQQTKELENGVKVPGTVTLSVLAKDADEIQLAADHGSIKLALRNSSELAGEKNSTISIKDLIVKKGTKDSEPELKATFKIDKDTYGLTVENEIVRIGKN